MVSSTSAADGGRRISLRIGDIVEAHKLDAGNQGREWLAVLCRMGDGKRRQRCGHEKEFSSARMRVLGRGRLWFLTGREHRRAPSLRAPSIASVPLFGEENAVEAGPLDEFARERRLKRILKKIGKMDGAASFAANHAHQPRMGVAERIDGDAAEKIEIFAPLRIVKTAAAAVREHYRRAPVGVHQVARFRSANLPRRERLRFLPNFFCAPFSTLSTRGLRGRLWRPYERWAEPACRGNVRLARQRPSARETVPPTIRTSETPPASARLAASSFRIMPPETLFLADELPRFLHHAQRAELFGRRALQRRP